MDNYDDIMNLPHHEPKHHPSMSMQSRAAQFAPFSALTGYEDAIRSAMPLDTDLPLGLSKNMFKRKSNKNPRQVMT